MSTMSIKFRFNSEKAIEAITYIASNAPVKDIYHICKILYLADKAHIEKYGRSICGDTYYAMPYGPVPGGVYDLLKDVRDNRKNNNYDHAAASFAVESTLSQKQVKPLRNCDFEVFSDSDLECLNASIAENGRKSFERLKRETHDKVWESADPNGEISAEALISQLQNGDMILEYIRENHATS